MRSLVSWLWLVAALVVTPHALTEEVREVRPRESGEPIPLGYRVEKRIRKGPVIAGAIVWGVLYAAAVSQVSEETTPWLAAPLFGPFVGAEDESQGPIWRGVMVLDGLAQITGATLLSYGLFAKREMLVPDAQARLVIAPRWCGRGYGLVAKGSF